MSKKSILMMLAVFVVGIAAVLFLPKTVQAAEDTYDEDFYLCIDGVGGKLMVRIKYSLSKRQMSLPQLIYQHIRQSVTVTNFADGDITDRMLTVKSLLP